MPRVLRRPRVNFEPEERSFDEYIFCSSCGDYVYEYCSIHGPLLVIPDDKVSSPTGFPPFVPRAALTIPHVFLHLARSTIPDADIGVFSTLTLPRDVRFGPYGGVKTNTPTPGYSWQLYDRDRKPAHAIDACDANKSNWMRYVNCSRHWSEQNLVAYQYQGQLYYRTIKIIPNCTELLVFYGSEFALSLGVDLTRYHSPASYTELHALNCEKDCTSIASETVVKNSIKLVVEKKDAQIFENTEIEQNFQVTNFANDFDVEQEKRKSTNETKDAIENNAYICEDCGESFKEKAQLVPHIATHNVIKEAIATNLNTYRLLKFACLNCDSKFPTKSELINHDIKMHDSKVNYKACNSCDYKTIDNYKLKRHMRVHSGFKPHNCDTCNAKFNISEGLKIHSTITDLKSYDCTVCDAKFNNSCSLKKHLGIHTGVTLHVCNICDAALSNTNNLKIHMRIHTGEKPYKCTVCGSKFTTSSRLNTHLRVHTGEKPYKCAICCSKFNTSGRLKVHLRVHTGEKPYKCGICSSKFSTSARLKIHLRVHTGEKPYKCSVCSSKFSTSSKLKAHSRVHTGEKPYQCNICQSKFTGSSQLKIHSRIHTGDKPYECSTCDAKFNSRSGLKRHFKIHTGEKPYLCTACDLKFGDNSAFNRHLRIHTGDKTYVCTVCESKFFDSYHLKRHMKSCGAKKSIV